MKSREANSLEYFQRVGTPIVAVATALGGPVAIVRVSGSELDFLERCIGPMPSHGSSSLRSLKDQNGEFLDEALVLFFKAPKSFSGEDVVEIQGHGVPALVERIVSELIFLGAKQALPGEFSFRSVLNNKMTLDDASRLQSVFANEGLGASSASTLLGFSKSKEDDVQKKFSESLEAVAAARGRVEAAIDFSEAEEEQAADIASAQNKLFQVQQSLRDLLNVYDVFVSNSRIPKVVLFGKPNAGKSTFLNLMCGATRSLVSPQAGTTRDYVEVNLKTERGVAFRLVDTAGLRNLAGSSSLNDQIEEAGIEMGLDLMAQADVLVWIQDARDAELDFGDPRVDLFLSSKENSEKCISIRTHGDLLLSDSANGSDGIYNLLAPQSRAAANYAFSEIEKQILKAKTENLNSSKALLSQRQELLVRESLSHVEDALGSLSGMRPLEIVGDSLRSLEASLRRAKGEGVSEDYIGQIFTQFCLGK